MKKYSVEENNICSYCVNTDCPTIHLKHMSCVIDCVGFEEYYESDKRLEILQEINDGLLQELESKGIDTEKCHIETCIYYSETNDLNCAANESVCEKCNFGENVGFMSKGKIDE